MDNRHLSVTKPKQTKQRLLDIDEYTLVPLSYQARVTFDSRRVLRTEATDHLSWDGTGHAMTS